MNTAPKLNLIPDEHKALLWRLRLLQFALSSLYFFIFFSCAVAVLLLAVRYTLQNQFTEIVNDTTRVTANHRSIEGNVNALNTLLSNATIIVNDSRPWGKFIKNFATIVPLGIHIQHVSFDAQGDSTIEGAADTREALVAFKNALSSAPYLTNINVPLNDLLSKSDIHFTVTFRIQFAQLPE